ncbi:hypothetical protein K501DRAFT_282872 [Backusella circina FSU 941]|nr:hypothetical protein K501DRAFT_282872 [Backusella circina FSU 941]
MDKWFDDQLKKMEIGGNIKAREFFESQADYTKNMSMNDKYHSHFAELYREKLSAEAEGRSWTPTLSTRPTNKHLGLNNTRSLSSRSSSPSMSGYGSDSFHSDDGTAGQKARNEDYFAKLGNANESRPDHLPPNQGGKFTGFGNPQFDYEPRQNAAPSLDLREIVNDPKEAINKGWSLLSYVGKAAVEFGRYANDNYVRPAASQLADPEFRSQVRDNVSNYVSSFAQKPNGASSYNGYSQMNSSSSNSSYLNGSYQNGSYQNGSSDTERSNTSNSLRYSHTGTQQQEDDDFFSSTMNKLKPDDNTRYTETATPPAKNRSPVGNVRARGGNTKKKVETTDNAGSDDEWGGW